MSSPVKNSVLKTDDFYLFTGVSIKLFALSLRILPHVLFPITEVHQLFRRGSRCAFINLVELTEWKGDLMKERIEK